MAIYTASFFEPRHHHGDLVPISRGIPPQYRGQVLEDHPLRWLLAPSQDLLDWWKRQEMRAIEFGWEFPNDQIIDQYTTIYREELAGEFPSIKDYLNQLDPGKDETWLCWEQAGEFCHRNLAYTLIEKYRPDCLGGQDAESTPSAIASPERENRLITASYPTQTTDSSSSLISGAFKGQINGDKDQGLELTPSPFVPGQLVQLKICPGVHYKFVADVPPTLTWNLADNPYCELRTRTGAKAFWLRKQLEAAP